MSNVQDTSREAYEGVKTRLAPCYEAILGVFYARPYVFDWTNDELATELKWSINRVTPRVLELRELGILKLTAPRPSKLSGNRCLAWRVKQ